MTVDFAVPAVVRRVFVPLFASMIFAIFFPASSPARADEIHMQEPRTADEILAECARIQADIVGKRDLAAFQQLYSDLRHLLDRAEKLPDAEDTVAATLSHDLAKLLIATNCTDSVEKYCEFWRETMENRRALSPAEWIDYYEIMGEAKNASGYYAEAVPLLDKSLSLRESLYPTSDSTFGAIYLNLGLALARTGDLSRADEYLDSAIAVFRRRGNIVIDSLLLVEEIKAYSAKIQSRFREADSMYSMVLHRAENSQAVNSRWLVSIYINLGSIKNQLADYRAAIDYYRLAQANCGQASLDNYEYYAVIQHDLGQIYRVMGDLEKAEKAFNAALDLMEKAGANDKRVYLPQLMYGLSAIQTDLGKYDEAFSWGEKALSNWSEMFGEKRGYTASLLANLAFIRIQQERTDEALPYLDRATKITADLADSGAANTRIAWMTALYHYSKGDYEQALAICREAMPAARRIYGPLHPFLCHIHLLMAESYAALGDYEESRECYDSLISLRRTIIRYAFSYSSSTQKLRWVNKQPIIDDSYLSMAMLSRDSAAIRNTFEMILAGKGIVLDALAAENEISYCSDDPEIPQTLRRLQNLRQNIAGITVASMTGDPGKSVRDTLTHLFAQEDSVDTELSRQCAEYDRSKNARKFTIADIADALGPDRILWEFIRYRPYRFTGTGIEESRSEDDRYLAYTLDSHGRIGEYDLGSAAIIDSLIQSVRNLIYNSGSYVYTPMASALEDQLGKLTRQLYDRIFSPLVPEGKVRKEIVVCPDGMLNILPFDILRTPQNQYVIEQYDISYLSSGRDLVHRHDNNNAAGYAVVMADPDYDAVSEETKAPAIGKHPLTGIGAGEFRAQYRGTASCFGANFLSLPYSRAEGETIAADLRTDRDIDTREYYGGDATESRLKHLAMPPRILHLATHAFFCENDQQHPSGATINPLTTSGLALAGANKGAQNGDENTSASSEDGILLAIEIANLNLTGTELVTVSGCETGIGELVNGEGVFGLRRAFQLAGAKSLVMSLWPIPDKETTTLLSGFYHYWTTGLSKQKALRRSALDMLKQCREKMGTGHPLFWGGFILVGNPN